MGVCVVWGMWIWVLNKDLLRLGNHPPAGAFPRPPQRRFSVSLIINAIIVHFGNNVNINYLNLLSGDMYGGPQKNATRGPRKHMAFFVFFAMTYL